MVTTVALTLPRFSPTDIVRLQQRIFSEILKTATYIRAANFIRISSADVQLLFNLYDTYFMNGCLQRQLHYTFEFRLSRRLTKTAGKTCFYYQKNHFIIKMSVPLFFQSFKQEETLIVSGLPCQNRLQALMRVIEHELIHVIEFITYGKSSCKAIRFKRLAHSLFLHNASTHDLNVETQPGLKNTHIKVGSYVSFEFRGIRHEGIVNRITKRATVLIRDDYGALIDKKGQRYSKYYIPLQQLTLISR